MFYEPKFCCQCGEKIDRPERRFWTSRRFCELCGTEFGIYERAPQIAGGILILFGLFGIGSFWSRPAKPLPFAPPQIAAANAPPIKTIAQVPTNASVQTPSAPHPTKAAATNGAPPPNSSIGKAAAPTESAEKVYFCGAPTKKGTMCSRRIKNGGRCWQHEGQAALLPQEKLLAAAR